MASSRGQCNARLGPRLGGPECVVCTHCCPKALRTTHTQVQAICDSHWVARWSEHAFWALFMPLDGLNRAQNFDHCCPMRVGRSQGQAQARAQKHTDVEQALQRAGKSCLTLTLSCVEAPVHRNRSTRTWSVAVVAMASMCADDEAT